MSWQELARCRETDPEVFFPGVGCSNTPAKAICARCDVTGQCAAQARRFTGDVHGVWAGQSQHERETVR